MIDFKGSHFEAAIILEFVKLRGAAIMQHETGVFTVGEQKESTDSSRGFLGLCQN